ncbi:hypothetical protein BCR39DRAFT_541416 [Naematelia encephala]|uniref:GST N-terminal domain-containing protein n=1 Tax=Naematelia encephala TaxID=71784 RepID=A0A1Y2AVT3_9TREE|nr:hypothetical protein BCR39DRAFT_541416 [Naematelia encephala]
MTGGITLYELVGTTGESRPQFSHHVWKTKLALAYLGKSAESIPLSFHSIRTELAEKTSNPKVTVPTIVCDEGIITDSWAIAEYLEKKYGAEKSLFSSGKSFSKFLEQWALDTLAPELRPLIGPTVYNRIDEPSQAYYVQSRVGGDISKMDAMVAKLSDASFVAAQTTAARARLQLIEDFLTYKKSIGAPLWLGDGVPCHGDFCVFGWYAFSGVNADATKIWESDSLPLVHEWLEGFFKAGLVKKEDLPTPV